MKIQFSFQITDTQKNRFPLTWQWELAAYIICWNNQLRICFGRSNDSDQELVCVDTRTDRISFLLMYCLETNLRVSFPKEHVVANQDHEILFCEADFSGEQGYRGLTVTWTFFTPQLRLGKRHCRPCPTSCSNYWSNNFHRPNKFNGSISISKSCLATNDGFNEHKYN